ncbi:MAG: AMIN domain-containing protein, partial [Deltaproteobacteria bacterium]|nr:AMIN domain-containing protein [Deltaproteobacteria bacterium]
AADKAAKVSSAAVTVDKNTVDITTSAGFSRLKYFELETPKRLVVDLFGVELADRIMKYDLAEGFTQLRVGPYADKLRFVFDTEKGLVPDYKVLSADNSVQVTWVAAKTEIPPKVSAASAPTSPEAVSARPVPI